MKTIIENIHRLEYLSNEQREALEQKAVYYMRYSNITFNVMTVDEKIVIVQTVQLKPFSENYADAKKLVKITEELFSTVLYGRKLRIGAKPFVEAPADVVTVQYIKDRMAKMKLKATDLELLLGIDKSTLSLYFNHKRELTRGIKSMFYYFFMSEDLKRKLEQYESK